MMDGITCWPQVHWGQAKVLEPEAHSDSEGDWKHEQAEDVFVCYAYDEPSKFWWKESAKNRAPFRVEEDFWEPWHQVPFASSRGSSHSS